MPKEKKMENISDNQLKIMMHSLGLDRRNKPYRNRYFAGSGHTNYDDLEDLREKELMVRSREGKDYYKYKVTEFGKKITFGCIKASSDYSLVRHKTKEEVREEFLTVIRSIINHWANAEDVTDEERCNGTAFSI